MLKTREAQLGFLNHLGRFAPRTGTLYGRVLERFICVAPEKIADIRIEHIEHFILSGIRKNTTRNVHLMALRCFYRWLEVTHDIENIARKVKHLKIMPPKQRIISREEYKKIIAATQGNMRDTIVFLAMTGLRAGEFLNLKPENITENFINIISSKTNKPRAIPLNDTLRDILLRNPNLEFSKSVNSQSGLWRLCFRAAQIANLKTPFGPHSCRHYFATQCILGKVPRAAVARMMGDTVQTLDTVYVHLNDLDLTGSTACLEEKIPAGHPHRVSTDLNPAGF